jgi:hypothetical protein
MIFPSTQVIGASIHQRKHTVTMTDSHIQFTFYPAGAYAAYAPTLHL